MYKGVRSGFHRTQWETFSESLIVYGGLTFENITSTDAYELNLNTFVWRKRHTNAIPANESALRYLTSFHHSGDTISALGDSRMFWCRELSDWRSNAHYRTLDQITFCQSAFYAPFNIKNMKVLNLTTNVWKKVSNIEGPEMPPCSNKCKLRKSVVSTSLFSVVSASQLFAYGRKEPNAPGILYRFDEKKEKWKEVAYNLNNTNMICSGFIFSISSPSQTIRTRDSGRKQNLLYERR